MGAGQSLPSQNQPPSKALHVLRVTPSSPASKTDIEPFFDFVVGFQGDALTNNLDAAELEKIVESHEGKTLDLVVWNSKNQESRGTVPGPSIIVVFDPLSCSLLTTIWFHIYITYSCPHCSFQDVDSVNSSDPCIRYQTFLVGLECSHVRARVLFGERMARLGCSGR